MNEELLTTLTWLIPVGPLLAFFVIVLFSNRSKTLSWIIAWIAIFSSLAFGWIVAISVFLEALRDGFHEIAEHPVVISSSFAWLPFGEFSNWLRMGVAVDPFTAAMLFMVPFATAMIFVYSVGYHRWGAGAGSHPVPGTPNHDGVEPLFSRFFAFMALFGGAMLTLVVADNLLLLFMAWEVMGLCSYLLIGFWYARNYDDPKATPPRKAAIKAFMTTRVGDVFMLLGIVFFYRAFGTLTFSEAFTVEGFERALELVAPGWLAIMAILLFAGTVGKSAQWPLHVWLPDAMEGPTPVSAIIHAAAMVSAGVYLVVRLFPLVAVANESSAMVGLVIGGIGAFTAIMAATIAVAQNDVKRVLAYSTISQLGYMVAAVGIGAYVAAAFHLITHAFFKALLFLGSGSIIHGMEHGAEHVHDHHTDPQDMMNMGGLRKKMPYTFWTFLIGGLALSGFPLITAGFWSKDEILADAWYQGNHGNALAMVIFVTLAIAALLTAFYTMRQISLTFFGKPRTPLADHAHESNGFMVVPLVALAFFAVTFGWLGIPDNFLGTKDIFTNYYHLFVGATVEELLHELEQLQYVAHGLEKLPFDIVPLATSVVVALLGLFVGYWIYGRKPLEEKQADPLVAPLGPLHTFLKNKWYWDELYQVVFIRPTVFFSEVVVSEWIDRGLIDGTLHLIARGTYWFGHYVRRFEEVVISGGVDAVKDGVLSMAKEFRTIQTGKIQEYALFSTGIASLLALLILAINYDWPNRILNWFSTIF
ncbi:MAG: NADH-quinone oxidoreductase subunit L [Ardenticatenaceae bacterium]|nr:NADH-quinone oxidoreductase subunit L [Ardenticatenaceae bacterium]